MKKRSNDRLLHFVTGLALALVAFDALAVHLNARGLGQVLLFPYYTVRSTPGGGTYNTLLSVTNTAADTKVIRVRFRESRNGREVAGINVFLVPFDSWTGGVVPGPGGPGFVTRDASCTDPALGSAGRLAFSNAQYSGGNADGEDASVDRASEGYVEIFEMGVVADATLLTALAPYRGDDNPGTANCNAARAVALDNATAIGAPSGGLMGSASIIDVAEGTLYPYDATAIDGFSRVPLWTRSSDIMTPSLADVNPKTSEIFDSAGYRQSSWDIAKGASPADPVSAILMQDHLINTYVLDPETQSATDWIVTMPTKPFYVQTAGSASTATPPFESVFGSRGAPDYFGLAPTTLEYRDYDFGDTQIFDREGIFPVEAFDWGPNPPPALIELSWTANVVTFDNSNLFASPTYAYVGAMSPSGWLRLAPYAYAGSAVHRLVSTDTPPHTYFGLPMIGFMANSYVNGALRGTSGTLVLSNYGATSPHKGSTRVE